MFPRPFQNFTVDSYMLPDFIASWVFCWIFLGIPVLAVILCLSRLPIAQRLRPRPAVWLLPLLGLLFGLTTGYFNAWSDHQSAITGQDHWYYFCDLFGAPGNGMANSYGGDWQWDEAWDYRTDIAIWNGLFWVSVATVGASLLTFGFRRSAPDTAPESTPAALSSMVPLPGDN
jgi:hypothetical protein